MQQSQMIKRYNARKILSLLIWSPYCLFNVIHLHHLKEEQITKYQEKKVKEIIRHSYDNVWYYNQLFKKANITPDDIKTISDLSKIPVSKKEDFRGLPLEKICDKNYNINNSLPYPSSGSSGIPLVNPYVPKDLLRQYIHFFVTQMERGVKITDKQVVIGADWIVTNKLQNILNVFPHKRLDATQKSELLIKQIREYKPKIMVAYPSAAMMIAKEIRENDIEDINIQKIFLSGENLDPSSKEYIADSYGAEVFDDYGANEVGGIAIECSKGKHHIWGDSVIVDIVKDGESVSIGEEGEITVTTLTNYLNPFIRYNCQDLGRLVHEKCSCGNNYPLMELIQGRSSDFIYLPDGNVVSALGVYPILNFIPGNKQFQVIQEDIGHIKIKMVKGKKFDSEKTIDQIKTTLEGLLGKIFIEVEIVEEIPKQHTGKLKVFISHLKKV